MLHRARWGCLKRTSRPQLTDNERQRPCLVANGVVAAKTRWLVDKKRHEEGRARLKVECHIGRAARRSRRPCRPLRTAYPCTDHLVVASAHRSGRTVDAGRTERRSSTPQAGLLCRCAPYVDGGTAGGFATTQLGSRRRWTDGPSPPTRLSSSTRRSSSADRWRNFLQCDRHMHFSYTCTTHGVATLFFCHPPEIGPRGVNRNVRKRVL